MKKTKLFSVLSLCTLASLAIHSVSFADDAETQVKNKAEDAKTGTKKTVRKGKKQVRKATGTDTTAKDAQDTANDAKDEATGAANKMKNKANQ